jgi:single-strand DNA-binding protein
MTDLNTVTIIGRLTRDAELKFTASGQAISSFSIAVNSQKKQGDAWVDDPSFFDVTYWCGNRSEGLAPFLTKGKQIGVAGRLKQDRWEKDGEKRSKVIIVAEAVNLLGSAQAGQGEAQKPQGKESHQAAQQDAQDDGFTDDIPF